MESAHRSYFHTGEQLNGSCLQHAKLFQHLLFLSVCYNKLSTTVVWREFRSFLPFGRRTRESYKAPRQLYWPACRAKRSPERSSERMLSGCSRMESFN